MQTPPFARHCYDRCSASLIREPQSFSCITHDDCFLCSRCAGGGLHRVPAALDSGGAHLPPAILVRAESIAGGLSLIILCDPIHIHQPCALMAGSSWPADSSLVCNSQPPKLHGLRVHGPDPRPVRGQARRLPARRCVECPGNGQVSGVLFWGIIASFTNICGAEIISFA